jgi:hypothetical protein
MTRLFGSASEAPLAGPELAAVQGGHAASALRSWSVGCLRPVSRLARHAGLLGHAERKRVPAGGDGQVRSGGDGKRKKAKAGRRQVLENKKPVGLLIPGAAEEMAAAAGRGRYWCFAHVCPAARTWATIDALQAANSKYTDTDKGFAVEVGYSRHFEFDLHPLPRAGPSCRWSRSPGCTSTSPATRRRCSAPRLGNGRGLAWLFPHLLQSERGLA